MIRFSLMTLFLIFARQGGQASTPVPSVFTGVSKTEAVWRQEKLAALPPNEFREQLSKPIEPNQPPLWLGPYTAPVAADTFRLLDQKRAAELLPMLWELNDKIFPEEKVLFAAACFKALPEGQKHPAFAKRLAVELQALMKNSPTWGDRDHPSWSSLMGRAAGALAGLWQGTEEERQWILRQVKNPKLHPSVRSEIIVQLSVILKPQAEEEVRKEWEELNMDTLRWRQLCLPWSDREKLRKFWGSHDWNGELLMPLALALEQPEEVRVSAILAVENILGKVDRLKTLLLSIASSADNHSRVRILAIRRLNWLWKQDEELKELLGRILRSPEESSSIRRESIQMMVSLWGEDASTRECLAAVVDLPDDHAPVQKAALEALERTGRDSWHLQFLLKIATDVKRLWPLRKKAMVLLGRGFDLNAAAKKELLAVVSNRREMAPVRAGAARSLSRASKNDEQIKRRLTLLLQSVQEDENVRIACLGALDLMREGRDNEWAKNLLIPLVEPQEKSVVLRAQILDMMPQMWRREAWLKDFFLTMYKSPDEPEQVRSVLIRALYNGRWGKEDWQKEVLLPLLQNLEQPVAVRQGSLETLARIWRGESWVVDLLMSIASSTTENPQLRQQAIMELGSATRPDGRVKDLLLAITKAPNEEPLVRRRAIMTRTLDNLETEILIKMAKSAAEDFSVREVAIDVLGRNWTTLTWAERGDFLASLAGPKEKHAQIRYKAAFQIALIRESMAFK